MWSWDLQMCTKALVCWPQQLPRQESSPARPSTRWALPCGPCHVDPPLEQVTPPESYPMCQKYASMSRIGFVAMPLMTALGHAVYACYQLHAYVIWNAWHAGMQATRKVGKM